LRWSNNTFTLCPRMCYTQVKLKVKQSRYTPWRSLGERRYSSYSFSTSALDRGEWSASRPGRAFTPGERTPGNHWTGGWVGLRAGLNTEAKGKILCPQRESNPDRPVVQPVVRHYTAWANPAPIILKYLTIKLSKWSHTFQYTWPNRYAVDSPYVFKGRVCTLLQCSSHTFWRRSPHYRHRLLAGKEKIRQAH
jgi:hypothetical protein